MLTSGADRQLAGMTSAYRTKNFAMFGVLDGEYEIAAPAKLQETEFASSTPRRVVGKAPSIGIELRWRCLLDLRR